MLKQCVNTCTIQFSYGSLIPSGFFLWAFFILNVRFGATVQLFHIFVTLQVILGQANVNTESYLQFHTARHKDKFLKTITVSTHLR